MYPVTENNVIEFLVIRSTLGLNRSTFTCIRSTLGPAQIDFCYKFTRYPNVTTVLPGALSNAF